MERSDAPACEVDKQLGLWFMVGEITDKPRSPHWHGSGHRCGSQDSTSASVRTRGFKSGGGHEGTPVAGRPADAAADDAPTLTRHTVERREVIVVPASSGAPLQAGSGEGVSTPSNPVPNLPKPTVARAQPSSDAVESSHHPSGEGVDNSGPGGDVPMEVAPSCGTDNEITRSSGGAR